MPFKGLKAPTPPFTVFKNWNRTFVHFLATITPSFFVPLLCLSQCHLCGGRDLAAILGSLKKISQQLHQIIQRYLFLCAYSQNAIYDLC